MTEVANASSSRLMGWGAGWPEQRGWKMASRVNVIIESFPIVKRPPAGSLKGVQCLGKAVVVGVGMTHIWRRSRDRSGGIAKQVLLRRSSILLAERMDSSSPTHSFPHRISRCVRQPLLWSLMIWDSR